MTTESSWQERWQHSLMDNYGTPAVMLVRGRGARVWDVDGCEYIDLLAGIAVNALGHADPRLVAAVSAQLASLGHTSNLAATEPAVALAERLVTLFGDPDARVFFCNSGAEANEAAFKIARLTGRTGMVVAANSFHGRTMGSLALTAQPAKQEPFRPLPGDVTVVEFGDADVLRAAVDESTAAIVLEPIQGEGGVRVPPTGYLADARRIADDVGALLILDEVQTGIGRTGAWFAHQMEEVRPDVMTLAKGLGGGLPIGAVVATGSSAAAFRPGSHGSTFGGNPVSCAAALAVLDAIAEDDLMTRAADLHNTITSAFIDHSHGLATGARGRGLLIAIELTGAMAGDLEKACRQAGLLVNAVGPTSIRLAPPLVLTDDDVREAVERWSAACASVSGAAS